MKGFPAVLLIGPDGSELGRLRGYSGKEAWEKELVNLVTKTKAKKEK